ncbi:MAG: hypothetical protein WEE66_06880 [Actinomycetota bacterium]
MFEVTETAGPGSPVTSDDDLIARADQLNATASRAQRELFALLREIDRREA